MPMLCRWLKPLEESGSRVPRRRLNAMVVVAYVLLLEKQRAVVCANEETRLGVVSESMFVDEEIDRFGEGSGTGHGRTHEASALPSPCRLTKVKRDCVCLSAETWRPYMCVRVWSLGEYEGGMGIRSGGERPGAMVMLLPRLPSSYLPIKPLCLQPLQCNRPKTLSMPLVGSQALGSWCDTYKGRPRRRSLVNFFHTRASAREALAMPYFASLTPDLFLPSP